VIYVFANDDRGLAVYGSHAQAIAACEAVDVEDNNYRFFDAAGQPLRPRVVQPTSRGLFTVSSGRYVLEPDLAQSSGTLASLLGEVSYVEGCGFTSAVAVAAELERHAAVGAHVPSNTSLERTRDR
jgi:hypothetical protein